LCTLEAFDLMRGCGSEIAVGKPILVQIFEMLDKPVLHFNDGISSRAPAQRGVLRFGIGLSAHLRSLRLRAGWGFRFRLLVLRPGERPPRSVWEGEDTASIFFDKSEWKVAIESNLAASTSKVSADSWRFTLNSRPHDAQMIGAPANKPYGSTRMGSLHSGHGMPGACVPWVLSRLSIGVILDA
jgi:hypothetical protein